MTEKIKGRISSFQSMGTLDGPGVRFVAFTQGCPLRCACCHNPETWDKNGGRVYTAEEVADRALKYKEYFGEEGGITVSGGEPLLQPEFTAEIFRLCRENKIGTCLDTSGAVTDVKNVLKFTDYCLLDIKYTEDTQYKKYVGCLLSLPLDFLKRLNERNIPTRIRQVIIKGLNDNADNIKRLKALVSPYECVKEIELLPFRKLCVSKYESRGLAFPLKNTPETTENEILNLKRLL